MDNIPNQNPECKLDLKINKRCKLKKKNGMEEREYVCVSFLQCVKSKMAGFHSPSRFLKILQ